MGEKLKLISLTGLSQFLTKLQAWVNAKLEVLDGKIARKTWRGTKAELEKAIADGLIDETTIVVITDDDMEEGNIIYVFATEGDIKSLFPDKTS